MCALMCGARGGRYGMHEAQDVLFALADSKGLLIEIPPRTLLALAARAVILSMTISKRFRLRPHPRQAMGQFFSRTPFCSVKSPRRASRE